MKNIIIIICVLFHTISWAACDCGSTDQASPCTGQSISVTVPVVTTINGAGGVPAVFNWAFNSGGGDARCGQFANGDYWVAPATGQSTVIVTGLTTTSPGTLYLDADPTAYSFGFLTHGTAAPGYPYYGYDAAQNIMSELPISYSTNTSLVAAMQRNTTIEGNCTTDCSDNQCVDAYHVVTVLGSVPTLAGAETIRPPLSAATKELLTLSDFDFTRIPSKAYLTGADAAELEKIRLRWSHSTDILGVGWSEDDGATWVGNYSGRAFRAWLLMHDYAMGAQKQWYDDIARLFSSSTPPSAAKTKAVAAMIAYGMDLYANGFNTPDGYEISWGGGAGQFQGKLPPLLFAGALEKENTTRQNNIKSLALGDIKRQPAEIGHIQEGHYGPIWGSLDDVYPVVRYWNDYIWSNCYNGHVGECNPSVGTKLAGDPHGYIDGPANLAGMDIGGYYGISHAGIVNMVLANILMPEMQALTNTTKALDFSIRARTHGVKALPDPCVAIDTREDISTCAIWTTGVGCEYYYPSGSIAHTWGPKSLTDINAGCVTDTTGSYTPVGRFPDQDGKPAPLNSGYVSTQLYNNYDTILAERNHRRLFRNVRLAAPVE